MEFANGHAAALDFGDDLVQLDAADKVVLAVPPSAAQGLVPGLQSPEDYRAIVNAHFKIAPPTNCPAILASSTGPSNGCFAFRDRMSVTISSADRLLDIAREKLAETIWAEVAEATRVEKPLPPWQIIKEKRRRSPRRLTKMRAGPALERPLPIWCSRAIGPRRDCPATIEGAIRSGNRAAGLIAASRLR